MTASWCGIRCSVPTRTVHVVIMMVLFRIDSLCFSVSACAGVNITATTRSFSLPMRTGTNVSVYHLCPKSSVLCQPYSPLVSYVSYPFTSHLESSGLSVVFHAISAPFRGSDGATTFGRHVQNSVTRKLVGRMSAGCPFPSSNISAGPLVPPSTSGPHNTSLSRPAPMI